MCGICGIVGANVDEKVDEIVVHKMMDRLYHRGPDGAGLVKKQNFIFGHRRLAIIDLDSGQQPMISGDGSITLVYNGEIYNYVELRQELVRKGVRFQTFSDTEVLLKLYEIEGESCIKRLNGMFAFAIYDQKRNKFFAARDHFGIKPFYFCITKNNNLVFASEIKAILEHPDVIAEPNYEAIQEYITFQFCLGNKTLFKNIFKLDPGHKITWDITQEKQYKLTSFWKSNFDVDEYHTEEYYSDKLLMLLQDSVDKQMRSDVPLGTYLSGGIDSSIMTALASIQYGGVLKTFTGRFKESPIYDESNFAKIIAVNNSVKLDIIEPNSIDFIENMTKLIYHLDEPVAGPGSFPQLMVSQVASKHVKVILGGQGADEIFGGYARYLVAYLEQALKGVIYETQEEGKHILTLKSMLHGLPLLKEYTPMLKSFWSDGTFGPMEERYFKLINRSGDMNLILTNDFLCTIDQKDIFEKFNNIFNRSDTKSYLNKMLYFDQQTLLPSLLQIEDRVSMAASLESRVPFLDYRIVELANKMPPKLKFKNGIPKNILRETTKNLLPAEITNRRDKMGFPVPLKEWLQTGPVREFVLDILLSTASRERNLFKIDVLEKQLSNEQPFGRQIWGALCLELWFNTFID